MLHINIGMGTYLVLLIYNKTGILRIGMIVTVLTVSSRSRCKVNKTVRNI